MATITVPNGDDVRAALIDAAAAVSLSLPVTELLNATEVAGSEEPWKSLLPGEDCRAVSAVLVGEVHGIIALAVGAELSRTVEDNAGDGTSFSDALAPVLSEAIDSISTIIRTQIVPESPFEFAPKSAFGRFASGVNFWSIELFDGDDHVATLAVVFGKKGAELPIPAAVSDQPALEAGDAALEPPEEADIASDEDADAQAFETPEFTPGIAPQVTFATIEHQIDLLSEVEMAVTAELGRTRLTIGELLALSPGAIVELNRSASAPIDLLVNGTLIARGEVVVIDEEFGIRISEVVGRPELAGTS